MPTVRFLSVNGGQNEAKWGNKISGPPDEESAHQQPPASDASKWAGFPIFLAMIAETGTGTFCDRSWDDTACRAIWQCIHSIGSDAAKGRRPVIIS
jgi:hypothetical protein